MSKSRLKPAVVLVADRTLSADYKILFEGIFATMQTTHVPEMVMRHFVAPPVAVDGDGRARTAPLGLRRVESALIDYTGLQKEDVVCTTPDYLPELLGPWVKIVGFSSSDPLGMGMSNTTTDKFWSGELYTRYWTRSILEVILAAKEKYHFRVVAGGAGAWQFMRYDDPVARDCIDVVFEGYFEESGPALFTEILNGKLVDRHQSEKSTSAEKICPLRHGSLLGIIELSRGCGRGCRFCTMAGKKMEHLSQDIILADLETNVANGVTSVVSGSEDFFRYGAGTLKPEFEPLRDLLVQMRQVKGLSFMQIDHANITSVVQLTDEQLKEIRRLLTWNKRADYLWVNMGVESANGRLVAGLCPGKVFPYDPDDWEDIVRQAAERMKRTGFFSVFSLVLGMPNETPDDIERTLKLVQYLGSQNAVIFPVFYEPLSADEKPFGIEDMQSNHLELYRTCYEINFKMVPKLFWDNQRAGGVSWLKRAAIRMLGKTEIFTWRSMFNKLDKQIRNRTRAGKQPHV